MANGNAAFIYLPGDHPIPPQPFASNLALGDSWFWYPTNNLVEALVRHMKDDAAPTQLMGYNGATLDSLTSQNGQYSKEYNWELRPDNFQYISCVFVSGAGNDAVDYKLSLKPDCSAITNPDDCFDAQSLDDFLRQLRGLFGRLIHDVWWAAEANQRLRMPKIFLHTYDYPVPDGRGFKLPGIKVTGPWLKNSMDAAHVPDDFDFRNAVTRTLIDRLAGMLQTLHQPERNVFLIDSRGALRSDKANYMTDWDNELHPTPSGFDTVVASKWLPQLQQYAPELLK
jgi:hypothetical protein